MLGTTSQDAPEFFPMVQSVLGGMGIATLTAVGMHFLNPPAPSDQKLLQQYQNDLQQEDDEGEPMQNFRGINVLRPSKCFLIEYAPSNRASASANSPRPP
jgi:hypothetical protein